MTDIETTIKRFIVQDILASEDESILNVDDLLLEREILDSVALVDLVIFLEQELNISIPPDALVPENFETVQKISAYLRSNGLAQ